MFRESGTDDDDRVIDDPVYVSQSNTNIVTKIIFHNVLHILLVYNTRRENHNHNHYKLNAYSYTIIPFHSIPFHSHNTYIHVHTVV